MKDRYPFVFRKRDLWLIVVLCLMGGGWLLVHHLTQGPGLEVQVTQDGAVVETLPLAQACTRVYETERGTNIMVIDGGQVMVTEASCPDHLCMNMGPIDQSGQSIICLPNHLVITVVGEAPAVDGFSR